MVAATPTKSKLAPFCDGQFNLCGFLDTESKDIVISNKFEKVKYFSEGLAAVRLQGKYGFINEKGSIVIDPKFDLVGDFYQGVAEVLVGKKTGAIDRTGKIIVEPQFARTIPFTKEVMIIRKGEWRQKHYDWTLRLDNITREHFGLRAGGYALYHIEHGLLMDNLALKRFDAEGRGLIWAKHITGLYGLLRSDGTWKVKPSFINVQPLYENRASVKIPDSGILKDDRLAKDWGAVDENGSLVIPTVHQRLGFWRNGFALVFEGNSKGLLDKQGNLLGGRFYSDVRTVEKIPPNNNKIALVLMDEKWFWLMQDGSLHDERKMLKDFIYSSCSNGIKMKYVKSKIQALYQNNEIATPQLFDEVRFKNSVSRAPFGDPSTNDYELDCLYPTPVKYNKKWNYIMTNGKLMFPTSKFEYVSSFGANWAVVILDGKSGLINKYGDYIVPPIYDTISEDDGTSSIIGRGDYFENIFTVTLGDKQFWIDRDGNKVSKPKPSQKERDLYRACTANSMIFEKNGLFGIRDDNGNEIIEPKYRGLHCFRNGIAWAAINSKKQWCPLLPNGEQSQFPKCKITKALIWCSHCREEKLHDDPYESNVLWHRAYRDFGLGKTDVPPKMSGGSGAF